MKKFVLTFTILCAFGTLVYSGNEKYSGKDKEVMQAAPPPCEWYRGNEWNLDIWGTYAFSDNTGHQNDFRPGDFEGVPEDSGTPPGANDPDQFIDIGHWGNDRFINRDGAMGGGADVKYFFNKYWALGVEGLVLDCNDNIGGAALGTVTIRYPIGCSRWAPYAFIGGGAVSGGSHTTRFFEEVHHLRTPTPPAAPFVAETEQRINHTLENKHTEALAQGGAGLEYRVTRHVGLMGDFAWNCVSGPDNNFGMARVGVTLSY